jgi:hypothetical protein
MGNDHQGRAGRGTAIEQQVHHAFACGAVEIAGRFVGKDDPGAWAERASNGNPLLLTARQLGGIMVQPVRQPDRRQFGFGTRKGIGFPGQFHRHGDILTRGHRGQEVEGLEDDADPAAPRNGQPVFVQRSEIGARHLDTPRGRALQPG